MPKVACLMMQKDEEDLILAWVLYHAKLFGLSNLFVYDNGSTSTVVINLLKNFSSLGLNVDWSRNLPKDFHQKGEILGSKIRELEASDRFDFFIPLDCDEFIAIDNNGIQFDADIINQGLNDLQDNRAFLVAWAFYNNLADQNCFFKWDHKKTFFASGTFGSLDHGYHKGVSRKAEGLCLTKFIHMHLHFKPYTTLQVHARNKLAAYVDVFDRKALESYQGVGYHVAKHLLISEEDYSARFRPSVGTAVPQFAKCLQDLGVRYPYV